VTDLFPGSLHVSSVELGSTPDATIWDYAKANGFAFVTKDKDFANLSLARGAPPKVVLVQTGNSSTELTDVRHHAAQSPANCLEINQRIVKVYTTFSTILRVRPSPKACLAEHSVAIMS
jgi:predicted nuclease of predicted toxin-antitoxin system